MSAIEYDADDNLGSRFASASEPFEIDDGPEREPAAETESEIDEPLEPGMYEFDGEVLRVYGAEERPDLSNPVSEVARSESPTIAALRAEKDDREEWVSRIEETHIYEASGIRYLGTVEDYPPGRYIQSDKPKTAFIDLDDIQ